MMVRHVMAWYGMTCYGMIWHGMRLHDMTAGLIELDVFIFRGDWGQFNVLLDASEWGRGSCKGGGS